MEKFTQFSLEKYLHALSSEESIPGGGSVSAYVAALAMGLSQMVIRVSLKRKPRKDWSKEQLAEDTKRRETLGKILDSLEKAKRDAFQIVNLDPEVYEEVMASCGDADKLEDALQNSFRLQADLAFLVVMAKEWNQNIAGLVSGSIKNDLIVSAGLLEGAFKGAYSTANINVVYMKDEQRRKHAEDALAELRTRFEKGAQDVAEASQTS